MTRDQDIVYEQALDVVAARMLNGWLVTLNQLLGAVTELQVRQKARRKSPEKMSDRDAEDRIAAAIRFRATRLRNLSDIATGRKRDLSDERI